MEEECKYCESKVFVFLLGSRRYFRIYHILGYDGRVLLGRRSHSSFMKWMIRLSGLHLHTTKEREIEAKK